MASAATKVTFDWTTFEAAIRSIGTEISIPVTDPTGVTQSLASTAVSPVPVATSRITPPADAAVASSTDFAYRRDQRPVRRSYASAPASYFTCASGVMVVRQP